MTTEEKTLELATEKECMERRLELIKGKVIKPADRAELVFRGDLILVSTKSVRKTERQKLIDRGIITPDLCDVPSPRRHHGSEEGEYKPRPIKSDDEYYRRRQAYFRLLQEILFARRELKIDLVSKKIDDPSWYF